jgi:hypothetical protein
MAKKEKIEYYSLNNILSKNAQYNIIFGERSNGKTYAVLNYGIENYFKNGKQLAVIRRWDTDFIGKRSRTMFDAIVSNGVIKRLSKGKYTKIIYKSMSWYMAYYDEELDKDILDSQPFAYAFSISAVEHDKSTAYPNIDTVLFDEFITRKGYLVDEFVGFMNVLSTIIRDRDDVKIFMCGNTVNQYCIYFTEMGLTHVKSMKQGDIDVYDYGDSGLRVAVEYADKKNNGKKSDVYFAFNNPKLKMITNGVWELDIYPHCPIKFEPKDIKFIYFIIFDRDILQCEIVKKKPNNEKTQVFTFIHRKTTPIKDENKDLVYSTEYNSRPNYRRKITKPMTDIEKFILSFYANEKVFYQDNEVGDIIYNYIKWCTS